MSTFKLECLECGSADVRVIYRIDYDYDEFPIYDGCSLYCNQCGNEEEIQEVIGYDDEKESICENYGYCYCINDSS